MGAGHWLNPTTGQCEQVTTHNDWIRDETNADSIGLAEDLYRQIMLLPDTAIDQIRILALRGGLVRIRQQKHYTSVQFWAIADQVNSILQAVLRALEALEVHPDERLEVDNLRLRDSMSITLRALQAGEAVFQQ
ncbi:MAG: hypothetical protein ACLP9L_39195 [Thermoguttaceae bacterium]